jgi:hypothetical protein
MKAFVYNGRRYLRVIPSKALFRSSMIHEVVNRGDIFGLDTETQMLHIIPGKAQVEHIEVEFGNTQPDLATAKQVKAVARMRAIRDALDERDGEAVTTSVAQAIKVAKAKHPDLFEETPL